MHHVSKRRGSSILATAVLLLASVLHADAHFCVSACGGGGMLCSRMAVQLSKGCRLGCKATFAADPVARRACADDCHAQVVSDRAACEVGVGDCRAICDTTTNEQCADDVCSVAYNECRDEVRAALRACVKAAGSDGAAVQACVEPGDAMLGTGRAGLGECLTNVTYGLSTCIAGCQAGRAEGPG
jgi:hypothetical protein